MSIKKQLCIISNETDTKSSKIQVSMQSLPKTVTVRRGKYEKQDGRSLEQLKENYFTITNDQMVTSRSIEISKRKKFNNFQMFRKY